MLNTEVLSDVINYNNNVNNTNSIKYLKFEKNKNYGVPNQSCNEIAFHPIQGILAVGSKNGKIKM